MSGRMRCLIATAALVVSLAACKASESPPDPTSIYEEAKQTLPTVEPKTTDSSRPRTCADADGPYVKGQDPEYDNYEDRDGDGVVCE